MSVLLLATSGLLASGAPPSLVVPRAAGQIHVDGALDEACYADNPPLADFVVAGEPLRCPQPTQAWLFWDDERLVFAFRVVDAQIVAAPQSRNPHDVDAQDRVEMFLWSGKPDDTYYCIEVGALGAVHAYSARFYRHFDDGWSPSGLKVAVMRTPAGYNVEGELRRSSMEAAGFRLRDGEGLRCGLFRADFQPGRPDAPIWICWVDSHGPKPDFHVAASFGAIVLSARDHGPPPH